MRVSLSAAAREGTCSKCNAGPLLVLPFALIVDDHAGDTEALCQGCLFDVEGVSVAVPMAPLAPGRAPRKQALRRAKKDSLKQELDIVTDFDEVFGEGATRRQPGSGNQPGAKSDHLIRKAHLRMEAKHTKDRSFSLKLDELYKLAGECENLEQPVFVIDYIDPGTRTLQDRFAVLFIHHLKELLRHVPRKHR